MGLYKLSQIDTSGGLLKCTVRAMPRENGQNIVGNMINMHDNSILDIIFLMAGRE